MEKIKQLKDLKIIDIIQMPAFEHHIRLIMYDINKARIDIESKYNVRLKRGPVERLQEKRVYNAKAFVALYAKILAKDMDVTEYPSALRTFIKEICDEALHKTVQQIKIEENEQKNT